MLYGLNLLSHTLIGQCNTVCLMRLSFPHKKEVHEKLWPFWMKEFPWITSHWFPVLNQLSYSETEASYPHYPLYVMSRTNCNGKRRISVQAGFSMQGPQSLRIKLWIINNLHTNAPIHSWLGSVIGNGYEWYMLSPFFTFIYALLPFFL